MASGDDLDKLIADAIKKVDLMESTHEVELAEMEKAKQRADDLVKSMEKFGKKLDSVIATASPAEPPRPTSLQDTEPVPPVETDDSPPITADASQEDTEPVPPVEPDNSPPITATLSASPSDSLVSSLEQDTEPDKEYKIWLGTRGHVLLVDGPVGIGKSVLTSAIVQKLHDTRERKTHTAVISLHLGFSSVPVLQDAIRQAQWYHDEHHNLDPESLSVTTDWGFEDLKSLLPPRKKGGKTFIIMDGLDGLDQLESVAKSLSEVVKLRHASRVRANFLLVTGDNGKISIEQLLNKINLAEGSHGMLNHQLEQIRETFLHALFDSAPVFQSQHSGLYSKHPMKQLSKHREELRAALEDMSKGSFILAHLLFWTLSTLAVACRDLDDESFVYQYSKLFDSWRSDIELSRQQGHTTRHLYNNLLGTIKKTSFFETSYCSRVFWCLKEVDLSFETTMGDMESLMRGRCRMEEYTGTRLGPNRCHVRREKCKQGNMPCKDGKECKENNHACPCGNFLSNGVRWRLADSSLGTLTGTQQLGGKQVQVDWAHQWCEDAVFAPPVSPTLPPPSVPPAMPSTMPDLLVTTIQKLEGQGAEGTPGRPVKKKDLK
ncbi:hypothetical protein QBC38DRAFT_439571 [Podospora fimiseda]|uniref:Nephrocystin 3-like N-terminal domain-containing protein n=1 Tax=Podospora fimiseda TaxID=252190 RepID=A0AAN7BYD7_9PEZI|nr:hypothetical protein QBC38DRAFT_439571 [Podospora fimiseda]